MNIPADDEYVAVYVTVDSEDVAVHIATSLVKNKLVACVNVQSGNRSIYEYEGIIQLENEVVLIIKTVRRHVPAVIDRIKEMHSYDIPCITVLPIIDGNPDYLQWISQQTS